MADLAVDADRAAIVRGLSEGEVRAVLERSNPMAAAGDLRTMAEIVTLVYNVIVELPKAKRREITREKTRFRRLLIDAAFHGRVDAPEQIHIEEAGPVRRSKGTGLGERLSLQEGRERLQRYATPRPLENWAGPVAGAGEIEKSMGIPRSTLSHWQKRGAVIGLLRGERKLAYPLDQFVDARPLEGLADVLKMAPDARSAWLWLRQPHGALEGKAPLDMLKSGERDLVVKIAGRDFQ